MSSTAHHLSSVVARGTAKRGPLIALVHLEMVSYSPSRDAVEEKRALMDGTGNECLHGLPHAEAGQQDRSAHSPRTRRTEQRRATHACRMQNAEPKIRLTSRDVIFPDMAPPATWPISLALSSHSTEAEGWSAESGSTCGHRATTCTTAAGCTLPARGSGAARTMAARLRRCQTKSEEDPGALIGVGRRR